MIIKNPPTPMPEKDFMGIVNRAVKSVYMFAAQRAVPDTYSKFLELFTEVQFYELWKRPSTTDRYLSKFSFESMHDDLKNFTRMANSLFWLELRGKLTVEELADFIVEMSPARGDVALRLESPEIVRRVMEADSMRKILIDNPWVIMAYYLTICYSVQERSHVNGK